MILALFRAVLTRIARLAAALASPDADDDVRRGGLSCW